MDELVKWFGKQLDEDAARAAQWHYLTCKLLDRPNPSLCNCGGTFREQREIHAKRAVLTAFADVAENYGRDDVEYADGWVSALGLAVRHLAAVYNERSGYRKEWGVDAP